MFVRLLGFLAGVFAMTLTRVSHSTVAEGGIGQVGGRLEHREFLQSVDLGSVAAATAENEDMAVTGVAVGDIVRSVSPTEALVANIAVTALSPVVAANVVRMRVVNPTAAAIDAAAVNFIVCVDRPL